MKSKQLLSFVLAFAAIFLLSAFVLTASADETTTTDAAFTVVDGTPSANPAENYTNLLDGKNSASSFTKWCVSPHTAQTYVVFKASREVVLAGYTFITGNDTYTHQGRNPKAWELYGCNDYETDANGGTWTLISSVTDGEMPVENFTSKYFNVKCDVGYKYFKFVIKEIASTSNNTLFQLCGINFSVNKNVMLGKTAISEGDLVYAGKYTYTYTKNKKTYNVFKKLPWRVLSTNGNDGSTDAMFLLSEYALEEKTYGTKNTPNDGQTYPANWYKSDLYTWLDDTFKPSAFENRELNYIKGTSLSSSVAAPFTDELKGEKFFLLSKDECETFGDNITGAKLFQGNRSYNFWLRTPSVSETDGNTVYSFYGGTSSKSDVDWNDITVRPACNFLTSKILFTVPATEGKTGAVGTLVKNVDYTGNEYKLTMETSDYKVRIVETEVAGMSGGTITFDYRCLIYNSKKVNNHYISAMIVDSDNNVLYYGRVANEQYNDSKTTTGSFDMVLPDDIADGNYTIKFFVEGVNDDQKLDYASDFYDVNLTVKSEDNVVLGTSILTGAQKSNVWLGTYKQSNKSSVEPIRWTVLDTAFKYNADSKNSLFLLTDMVIDKKAYNETDTDVTWATSTVRTWLNGTGTDDFYGTAFSETEKNAVLTTKVKNDDVNNMKGGDDTTDKVFLLSYAEANTEKYFKKDDYLGDTTKYVGGYSSSNIVSSYKTYNWWLRSPGTSQNRAVFQPSLMENTVTMMYGIRPAINLDHAAVLFTTAAKDGKPSETGLFKNGVNGGNDYKLTLKDSSSFNLNDTSRRALKNGESVTLQYTKTASMSYISAMIVNAQNKVLYYGWLDKTASGSGSVTFTVPDELTAGTYTVNVFGETRNGDYYVDSASAFSSFTLEVSESEAKAVTTAGKTTLGSLSEVLNVAKNNEGSTVTLLKNYTGDITFDGGKFNFNTGNFTFNGASSGYSQNIRVKKNTELTITGGTFILPGTYYSLVNEGTLNITGGTFNFGNLGRLVASIGTLNISGGDVNGNVTVEAGTFKVSGGQIKRLIVTTSEPGSTGIGIDAFIPTVTINGGKFKRIESMIHMNAEGFTYPKTLSELLADGYAFKYKGNWVDGTLYEVGDANGTDFVTVEKAPIVSYKSSADNATDYGTSSTFKIYDVVVNDGYAAGDVTYVWKDNGVTVSSTTAEWSQVLAEGEHEVTCTLTLDGYSVPHKFEKKTIVKPERIITLDASALSGYTVKNGYKYVYYGTYNGKAVKWRVLATAYKYDAADTTKTGMLLLSENALAATQFGTDDNIWHGSTALIWCNNMYGSSFGTGDGTKEQDFILRTSSTDGVNEYLFFLSKDEASKPEYFPNDSNRIATLNSGAAWWWLRSPYQYDGESAYIVYDDGSIDGAYVTSSHGARPAFNLNPAYVLFTFGKGAKPITFGTMQKNGYYEPASGEKYEYKLTMLDEKRNNFAVNTTKVKGDKGQRIAIDFSDATDGGSEAISAMIVDKTTGEVLYYGQGEKGNVVTDGGTMSGTVYFVLPTDIAYGEYVLKVFNEQLNGNGKTDFSSDFKTLTLKVAPKASFETEPTAITNLSYNGMPQALVTAGTSNEGVVKYAMDENAVYSESVPQQTFVHNNYKVWFYVEGDDDHADSDKEYVTASISAKDIAGATITLAGGLTYNGQAQTQGVTKVEIDGMTLADGEYDVADNVATNAGNYTLTVTGKGNFAGTQTEDFRIEKLPVEIEWSAENEYVYDSTVKSVTASVKNRKGTDDVNLVTDGTFSATDVGDYTAEIKGVENPNYTTDGVQNLTKNWKITTTASDIVLNVPTSVEYGDDLTITVNVAKKGNLMSLMAAEDEVAFYVGEGTNKKSLGTVRVNYTASDEGTATLTVKTTDKQLAIGANVISAEYGGSANLAGGSSANKTVTMTKKPISLTWNNDVGLVYDGTEKAVGATAGGTEDGDGTITVTVTGGTEKKAGKHTATATGLDGSNAQYYELPNDVQHEYTIARRAIDAEWTVPSNAVYNRSEYTVTAKVKNAVNGDSVKLTLKNNVKTDKGDYIAEVIAADDDNYTLTNGTNLTKEWSISAKDIAGATITLAGGLTYNGQAQTQGVTKVEIDGMTLADGEYDVADNVATNAGNYTLTVTGKGNFTGTQTEDWNILTASPTEKVETTARILKNIELTYATVTYGEMAGVDGKALEGTFEWVDDTKKLSKNSTEQMIFTPNDSNYKAIKFDVDVTTFESSGGSFVAARYTVKFDTNGGSKIANQTVTNNKKATRPAKPTKDGYIFDDWYADKDLTVRYDFAKPVTADITLYAKWDKDEVQVPTTAEWKNPFTDVKKGDWFYDNVKFAHQNGLMNGVEKTLFAPDESLTRAMLVTVLWRLEGQPSVDYAIPFTDIDENEYYVEALRWAASEKIVLGVSETEFAPDDDIIREQIAAIMFRYAKYKGYDVTIGEDTNILSYTDYDEISEYAIEAMQYAVGSGLIKGKTESTLNPLDNATRAEAAAILQRFIEAN